MLLIHLITNKLDAATKRKWLIDVENRHSSDSLPTMKEFLKFLSHRCTVLEALDTNKSSEGGKAADNFAKYKTSNKGTGSSSRSFYTSNQSCVICEEQHLIFSCKKFTDMTIDPRRNEVQRLRLCWNCLRPGHGVQKCTTGGCRKCGKKHTHYFMKKLKRVKVMGQRHIISQVKMPNRV